MPLSSRSQGSADFRIFEDWRLPSCNGDNGLHIEGFGVTPFSGGGRCTLYGSLGLVWVEGEQSEGEVMMIPIQLESSTIAVIYLYRGRREIFLFFIR